MKKYQAIIRRRTVSYRRRLHVEGAGGEWALDTTTTGFTMVVELRYCVLTVIGATLPLPFTT